jgi:phosphoglycolate phosphatase-like HAD superfamily hydrolase
VSKPAVIFDIDYTMLEISPSHLEAFADVCERYTGVRKTVEPHHHGLTDYWIMKALLEENGTDPGTVEGGLSACMEQLADRYLARSADETPIVFAGVKELLERLRPDYLLGVVSGNVEAIGWARLEESGLKTFFQAGAFGGQPVQRYELVTQAAGHLAVEVARSWVVGDTSRDIAAARQAGARSIGVATGFTSEEALRTAGADSVVADLVDTDHLVKVIGSIG